MTQFDRKNHWENIYDTKALEEVSWYQLVPKTSLKFIQSLNLVKDAAIIDIGGGDSFLADRLLDLGYTNVSVLDISERAVSRAKERLGKKADKVKWIVSDITEFAPTEKYDVWHDRAAFHFLTSDGDVASYIETAGQSIKPNGSMLIGTFSENGPKKCSGIEIRQYSEDSLSDTFGSKFQKVNCFTVNHKTPFDTVQNFVFCSFRKK